MMIVSNFRSRAVESEWEKERIFLEEFTHKILGIPAIPLTEVGFAGARIGSVPGGREFS
jgi:hypothetical protein